MKIPNLRNSDSEKERSDSRIILKCSKEPKITGDHLLSIPDVFRHLVLICYWYLSKVSSILAIWWNTLVMIVYIGSITRSVPPIDQKSFGVHSLKFSSSCDAYKSLCFRFLISPAHQHPEFRFSFHSFGPSARLRWARNLIFEDLERSTKSA